MGTFRDERTVKVVPLELIELGKMGTLKKMGAFGTNRTENVGAFRANKTQKGGGGLYRGTYPYRFNMGVTPPGTRYLASHLCLHTIISNARSLAS